MDANNVITAKRFTVEKYISRTQLTQSRRNMKMILERVASAEMIEKVRNEGYAISTMIFKWTDRGSNKVLTIESIAFIDNTGGFNND